MNLKIFSLFRIFTCVLALSCTSPLASQDASNRSARNTGPKNGILLVVGYEMEKVRADAILQSQDMTTNVKPLIDKLELLAKAKGADRGACAAQIIRSGMRTTLDMGTSSFEIEPIISPAQSVSLNMVRKEKLSGIESVGSAVLNIGEYAFIGTVPDVKPGRDALLFVRIVMHYLEK
ncbi:MAG: hypothetical protein IPK22_24265 [Verrucomicrobiaceae bacterium]|nr:hypothetical protein [Verrucomicrobiaceae bacterium]